jgi:hypothetical protein
VVLRLDGAKQRPGEDREKEGEEGLRKDQRREQQGPEPGEYGAEQRCARA